MDHKKLIESITQFSFLYNKKMSFLETSLFSPTKRGNCTERFNTDRTSVHRPCP